MAKTLLDHCDEYLGRGHGKGILEHLREVLAKQPELIEELLPDMVLRPRPLTNGERAKRAVSVALVNRQKEVERRHEAALKVIRAFLKLKSDCSLRQIARQLDEAGVKPARGDLWSPASVRTIMIKAGLIEPSKA